jgi:DNA repair photolyase
MKTIERLASAGIPVGVLVAPVIPFLTDHEIEPVLEAAHAAGAQSAGYVLMRLPYELKDLFRNWLEVHYPLKAKHVMSRVNEMRGGRDNDPNFGSRMVGGGELAELLGRRFAIASKRFGFDTGKRHRTPITTRFRPPVVKRDGDTQLALF